VSDLANCKRCSLHQHRTNVVFGADILKNSVGKARIVFIGEAPGRDEDKQEVPFVGKAGQLLQKIIKGIGLEEEDYYITNTVKCRPVKSGTNKNGKPTITQTLKCASLLNKELNAIKPNLIITLGGYAKDRILDIPGPITPLENTLYWSETYKNVFVMLHPANLIYDKEKYKPVFQKNVKKLKKIIKDMDILSPEAKVWEEIDTKKELLWLKVK